MSPDPWLDQIPGTYALGDTVDGRVISITDFGIFIELENEVEGLVHISEIEKKSDEKMEDLFKIGDEVTARVINVNPSDRKIDLSMKTMIG
jgi:small subunit ribosomal protein S1